MSVLLAAAVVVVCGVESVAGSVAPPAFSDGAPDLLALQPILRSHNNLRTLGTRGTNPSAVSSLSFVNYDQAPLDATIS